MLIRLLILLPLFAVPARADPVADWIAGAELAATARAERDPILLAAASRQKALAEAADGSLAGAPGNARETLDEARRLAGGDAVALAVVERYAGLANRGSAGGTSTRAITLKPGAEATMLQPFERGRSAIVFAEASSAFELEVGDGPAMCRKAIAGGQAICRWIPPSDGPIPIRLRNAGAGDIRITLITN